MSVKNLSTDFAFYGLIDIIQRSVTIVLLPFYTRILNQNDFGQLDIFLSLVSLLGVIIDFQFISGVTRLYYEFISRNLGERFAGTVIFFRLLIGLILVVIINIFGFSGLLEFKFIPSFLSNQLCWFLVLVFVPVSLTFDALMSQSRMLREKVPFASGALVNSVFTAGGGVVTTMILDWGIAGILVAMLLGRLFGGLFLFVGLREKIRICIDLKILGSLLNYCVPLIPGWWLGFSASYIGRFFIYGELGPEENGLLAVSLKLQSLMSVFAISFRSAWQPLAMSFIQDKNGDDFYVRSMRLFLSFGFFITIVFNAFIDPIINFFAPLTYSAVVLTFAIFSVANLIGELESNLQLGCQIAKKTVWISIGSFISFIIVVFILYYCIDSLGVAAFGIALLVSSFVRTILTYVCSQYFRYIQYDLKSFQMFGLGCLLILFNVQIKEVLSIPTLVWHIILTVVGLFLSFKMLHSSEIKAMKSVVQSIRFKY